MEYIGYIAGCLSVINFFPQIIKLLDTKSSKDLSLGRESLLSTSVLLWLIYGITLNNIPMILANTSVLILDLIVIALIFRYRKNER